MAEDKGYTTIEALIVNTSDMVEMFGDIDRLKNSDFARKWHSFPTTQEALTATLQELGIDNDTHNNYSINDFLTCIEELDDVLPRLADLNELNYLASRLSEMSEEERDTFAAVIQSGKHCESLKDIINIDQNLDNFDLQPAYNAEQYGEFLLIKDRDDAAYAIDRLRLSDDVALNELASYIEQLEECADPTAYARSKIALEQGIFTDNGYLTEVSEFHEIYKGTQDIPAEYQVSELPEPMRFMKVENTDLTSLLAKIHAVAGNYVTDVHYNLNVLEAKRSAEYLVLMNGSNIYLTEAAHAYRRASDAFDIFMNAPENADTKAFALHVTDMHNGNVRGDIALVDLHDLQLDIIGNIIHPTRYDAVQKFGSDVSFSPDEWAKLEPIDKDKFQSWTRHFTSEDSGAVRRHLEETAYKHAQQGGSVEANKLLASLSNSYMAKAENPQPNMLRLSLAAAKDMLTNSDSVVYRLLPKGAEELSPLEAMHSRGGLYYEHYQEFAIKKEDIGKLDKFADRQIETLVIGRKPERDAPEKPKTKEPEL